MINKHLLTYSKMALGTRLTLATANSAARQWWLLCCLFNCTQHALDMCSEERSVPGYQDSLISTHGRVIHNNSYMWKSNPYFASILAQVALTAAQGSIFKPRPWDAFYQHFYINRREGTYTIVKGKYFSLYFFYIKKCICMWTRAHTIICISYHGSWSKSLRPVTLNTKYINILENQGVATISQFLPNSFSVSDFSLPACKISGLHCSFCFHIDIFKPLGKLALAQLLFSSSQSCPSWGLRTGKSLLLGDTPLKTRLVVVSQEQGQQEEEDHTGNLKWPLTEISD